MRSPVARSLAVLLALLLVASEASASVFHIVRPGDTVSSIAMAYYGDAGRADILRAANALPLEDEVELALGEPLVVPEVSRRMVGEDESWQDLARIELGTPDRAWYLAEVNDADEGQAPAKGQIVTIPYLMPLSLSEGLAATVQRFYPSTTGPARVAKARMLIELNPGLRPRGMPRGTRIVLPFDELTILPEKRAEVDRRLASHRSEGQQEEQEEATEQLERLPSLLSSGAFVEVLLLASRIAGGAELTEAQRLTLHRYLGQSLLALDRPDLAREQFISLLRLQPDFQFDQVTTSPVVIEALDQARRRAREQQE